MDLPSPRELELETLVRERDAHIAELTDEVLHLRQFLSTQTVNPPTDPVSLPPALVSLLLPHIDSRTSNATPTSTPITEALTQRVKVLQEENNELFELLNTGETGRLKDDVRALRRIVQKLEGALRESHQTIISLSDELEKSQAAMQSYSRPNNLHSHSQSPVPRQTHHRVSHQNSTNGTKKPVPTGPRAHKKPRLSESQTSPPPRANASLPLPPRVNRSQSSSTRRNDSRERSPRVSADRKTPYTKMEVDDDDRKRPRSPEQSRDGGPPPPLPPPMRERERGEREHAKERSSRDHRPRDRERDRDRNRDRGRDVRDRDREHEKERDRERGEREREREYDRDHDRSSRRNGGGGGGGVGGGVSRRTRRNSNSNNPFLGGDRTLAERMGL